MNGNEFVRLVQKRLAGGAIGPSTLRNQGAQGTADAARRFLTDLDLTPLREIETGSYKGLLDEWTRHLLDALPEGARNWGTARKALNVFLVEVFFNRFTAQWYRMARLADVLETPLDSQAATKLKRSAGRGKLPQWPGLVGLEPRVSEQFQDYASRFAADKGVSRAALDLILWRRGEA